MEQKKIDIAELLIDAPKGTKLYSPICGEVKLRQSSNADGYIEVTDNCNDVWEFYQDGRYDKYGECLLFPSKEVRDWGCFRVKYVKLTNDFQQNCKLIKLLCTNIELAKSDIKDCDSTCYAYQNAINGSLDVTCDEDIINYILSTGTELKLEEEQPKFKVGDVVAFTPIAIGSAGIGVVKNAKSFLVEEFDGVDKNIRTTCHDTSHLRLATPEEITKWNKEVLEPNHMHYSTGKRKIIHWFLPFDRVIERYKDYDEVGEWTVGLFSHYCKDNPYYPYRTLCGFTNECLPYNEETMKLIGTTDDYEEE